MFKKKRKYIYVSLARQQQGEQAVAGVYIPSSAH